MTIAALGVVAVVVLEGPPPVTLSYVAGAVVWELLCIAAWWLLWRPRS